MTVFAWYSLVGAVLFTLGLVTMLLAADRFRRLVALNIAAAGSLVLLLAVAGRGDEPDPVLHALALTGIVITVAFTGFGVVLARRIDETETDPGSDSAAAVDPREGGEAR